MNQFNKGNIFLLELVVDFVQLYGEKNGSPYSNEETCVTFGFLNNGPIYVREDEFKNQKEVNENDYIKYGKSCLFSLSPAKMVESFNNFNVDVNVYKVIKSGNEEEPMMKWSGRSVIPLLYLYHELMGEMYVRNDEGVISKNLDGCFELLDHDNRKSGLINLFMRITCFGKVLVSNIKMNIKGDELEYVNESRNVGEPHVIQFTKPSRKDGFEGIINESRYGHRISKRQKLSPSSKQRYSCGNCAVKMVETGIGRYHCNGRKSNPQ